MKKDTNLWKKVTKNVNLDHKKPFHNVKNTQTCEKSHKKSQDCDKKTKTSEKKPQIC